jgi:hypothetical protein
VSGSHGSRDSGPTIPAWWPALAALPAAVGALWLWWAAQAGLVGLALGAAPGALLLATGLSNLLWAGDARIFQFMSLGALAGVIFAPAGIFTFGPVASLALLLASAASFITTGYLAIRQEPVPPEVPEPRVGLGVTARAAGDEASMCGIVLTTWPLSVGRRAARIGGELEEARRMFEERGWLESPATYHREPPPLEDPRRSVRRNRSGSFEHLSFESGYEPWPGEPGRERWLSYVRNRTAHAWVLRHPGEPRPWMVCIHGIRMGSPRNDLRLFRPEYLHRELGLNLLLPILPLHGPRRVGQISGDRIMAGDVMDSLHAGAQMAWDIRRLTSWLHLQDAPAVGVLGHSLGGYATTLLCCLDETLDCAAAGNPAVDPSRLFWRSALSLATRYLRSEGVNEESMGELLRPISPLSLAPKVPREGLCIFASVADRVVPVSEAVSLWKRWERPRAEWYGGTHRSFLDRPEVRAALEDTLRASGMLAKPRR